MVDCFRAEGEPTSPRTASGEREGPTAPKSFTWDSIRRADAADDRWKPRRAFPASRMPSSRRLSAEMPSANQRRTGYQRPSPAARPEPATDQRADPHQSRPPDRRQRRAARRRAHRAGHGPGPRGQARPGRGGRQRTAAGLQDPGLRQVPLPAVAQGTKTRRSTSRSSRKSASAPRPATTTSTPRSTRPASSWNTSDKVLVNVLFRGRELQHIEEGRRIIIGILEKLADVAKVEKAAVDGRQAHDGHAGAQSVSKRRRGEFCRLPSADPCRMSGDPPAPSAARAGRFCTMPVPHDG